MMRHLAGIPASPGIAIGPLFRYRTTQLQIERRSVSDPQSEHARLKAAIQAARSEVQEVRVRAERKLGAEEAAVFDAQDLILQDPALLEKVRRTIERSAINAESAWQDAAEGYALELEALQDEYLQARAADVRDVAARVLRLLMGVAQPDPDRPDEPSIVFAVDLSPSETASLDTDLVLGFCTAEGGPTSHTAIFAKALGIPAVVGAGRAVLELNQARPAILDGGQGLVIAEPDLPTRERYERLAAETAERAKHDLAAARQPAVTTDGHAVEIAANVGSLPDAKAALEHGAEGIGLLRTEFLYLNRELEPDEAEQMQAYGDIFSLMETRPIVVRTLDVGGDKQLPYLDLTNEANPFLGWRAIRISLDRPKFFKKQLRALLRAGADRDLRIMFPMISTLQELQQARRLLEQAQAELEDRQVRHAQQPQVGIMVEVPSVAVLAERFAPEVDFFSIGTNDLAQYVMAAERTNPKTAHLNDGCHPAVLALVRQVIEAGHSAGIWVGLCGELAGDPDAIPVLLGLGLDEFSMAPAMIPRAKATIRSWSRGEAFQLAQRALELAGAAEVRALVQNYIP